jgi:gluconolactonase
MAVIPLSDSASAIFATDARLRALGSGGLWLEGPVWIAHERCVLMSDIPNNRMLIWRASHGLRVWREAVEYTNGHCLHHDGSLLHCSHGQRAIVRTRFGARGVDGAGGPVSTRDCVDEVLVDRYEGRRLNSPNDIVVHSDGSIWFTDPPYGIVSNREGHLAPREQPHHYVFRFEPDRADSLRAMSHFVDEPNGLAFSPNERTLYVSDTSAALRADGGGNHHIVAFDVEDGPMLTRPRVVREIEPGLADGFKVDVYGRIFTSSDDSVQVLSPDGEMLARIEVPEKVGNLCFGGDSYSELFICASSSLYHIALNVPGAA